jgi:hypothetical protein
MTNETYPYLSFGHELLDAELLEVTVPVFMDCVEGLPRNSLNIDSTSQNTSELSQ